LKNAFLSFKNFEPEEMLKFLPIVDSIEELVRNTKLNPKLTNVIESQHPDSATFQTMTVRALGFKHMGSY